MLCYVVSMSDFRFTCFAGSLYKARVTVCRDLLLWVILRDCSLHRVAVGCEASQCSLYCTCISDSATLGYTHSEKFAYFLWGYQRDFENEHRLI